LIADNNPNLVFDNGNDFLQHKIDQARKKAEQDLIDAQEARRAKEAEARNIVASVFEEAAEIAFSGIELGLDTKTCKDISAALRLQAAIVRGDVH
jgi:hypothetical protein